MKVIAINGGPRKHWNTATLLEEALRGAQSAGAETERIDLYDLDYKGCISCFACKRKGVLPDQCAVRDDLAPVLKRIHECDAVILGSPIYFSEVTGAMRALMERVCFPYISYDNAPVSFGRAIRSAFIYTMNVPEPALSKVGYDAKFTATEALLKRIFGSAESLAVTETFQFDDYDKYASSMFDAAERRKRRETVFPEDCRKAFELGRRMCLPVQA